MLESGKDVNIDLIKGLPYNCKLSLALKKPPLHLVLKYDGPGFIVICGSFKVKEPTLAKNHMVITGRRKLVKIGPMEDDAKEFQNAFLYFSIECSDERMKLVIRPTFPEMDFEFLQNTLKFQVGPRLSLAQRKEQTKEQLGLIAEEYEALREKQAVAM